MRGPLASLCFLFACQAASPPASSPAPPADSGLATSDSAAITDPTTHLPPDLPHHDECLPMGQEMDDDTCLAVVAHDGRYPGQSFDKSGVKPRPNDPRVGSDDLAWITAETRRCTCACCHQSSLGGPGAFFWDLDYEGDVWLDSASDWSLRVLAGIYESENQRLPTTDPERLQAIVEAEIERRGR